MNFMGAQPTTWAPVEEIGTIQASVSMPADLKATTMDPATRTLARVVLDEKGLPAFELLVETLMGKKAELRFQYIQEHAKFVEEVDV